MILKNYGKNYIKKQKRKRGDKMKNYKHKWIETLIVEDQHHLLREKDEQSYISYQYERLFLFIKHLIKGKKEE